MSILSREPAVSWFVVPALFRQDAGTTKQGITRKTRP
jgi:hypothetical protein